MDVALLSVEVGDVRVVGAWEEGQAECLVARFPDREKQVAESFSACDVGARVESERDVGVVGTLLVFADLRGELFVAVIFEEGHALFARLLAPEQLHAHRLFLLRLVHRLLRQHLLVQCFLRCLFFHLFCISLIFWIIIIYIILVLTVLIIA